MQSTGEVIGIAEDPRVAMAKALTGASLVPPRRGRGRGAARAALDRGPRQVGPARRWRGRSRRAGYRLAATPGTRAALREAGFGVEPVAKLGAEPDAEIGERPILELIADGDVRLVVNTPTPRSGAVRDAAEIRHAAIAEGVLCLTAIETGIAAAEALDPAIDDADRRGPADHRLGAVERRGGRQRLSPAARARARGYERRDVRRDGGLAARSPRRSPGPATTA